MPADVTGLSNNKIQKLIVVKLQGGLGNQMFQYAFGRALGTKHNCKVYFDFSFFRLKEAPELFTSRNFELGIFNIQVPEADYKLVDSFKHESFLNKLLRKFSLPYKKVILETCSNYNKSILDVKFPAYFEGYWQCENYFDQITALLKKEFTFQTSLDNKTILLKQKISASNAVSVHVRRGDFITSAKNISFHGTCPVSYYQQAFKIIFSKYQNIHYYFFSDDPEWVSKNLIDEQQNFTIVQHNSNLDNWKDMYLMSQCKHHIIANSSFSWWGAWLCNYTDKTIIAPQKWFATDDPKMDTTDLIPATWIRI